MSKKEGTEGRRRERKRGGRKGREERERGMEGGKEEGEREGGNKFNTLSALSSCSPQYPPVA